MCAERAASRALPPALQARARKQAAEAFHRALAVRRICLGNDHQQTLAASRGLKQL